MDWIDVSSALPQYVGHYQPRLPGELGYYDYRAVEVLRRQTELAAQYGIHAFCFHLPPGAGSSISTPLNSYLSNATLGLSFCAWCSDDGLLPSQDIAFALRDPRYLRVGGKPLLVLDSGTTRSESEATVHRWRAHAEKWGVGEIFVALATEEDPRRLGADAAIETPSVALPAWAGTHRRVTLANPYYRGNVLDYSAVADHARHLPPRDFELIRTVFPSWDTEPSQPQRGCSLLNSTPDRYRSWLAAAIAHARRHPVGGEAFVFVNGWNNWVEGAYLEPDRRYGYAFLQATRDALTVEAAPVASVPTQRPEAPATVIVHAFYPDQLPEMLALLGSWRRSYDLHITSPPECEDKIRTHLGRAGIEATLYCYENRGRDVLPFLQVARELSSTGERLVLKLHTKRSLHRGDGERWRRDLMAKLLAPDSAGRIIEAMLADSQIGMVAPEGHVLSLHSYWASNRSRVQELAYRMGLPPVASDRLAFVAGSMFWSRMAALRPLLELGLDSSDFEPEAGQLDGTLAHAIERGFALATLRAGLRLTESSDPHAEVAEGRRRYLHAPEPEEGPSRLPPDFDPTAYLRANPDVRATGQDPAEHYLTLGWLEGRRW